MRFILAVAMALIFATGVQAQEIRGGYVGASLGSFNFRDDGETVGLRISESAASYRVVGGYHFNSNYALEAGWGATGDLSETFRGFDQQGNPASLEVEGDYEIASVRFMVLAPFAGISMFGGAGYYDATRTMSVRFASAGGDMLDTSEHSDSGVTAVGGVVFELDRLAIRGEYEWFDTDGDIEATNISVGVLFRF